MCKYIYLASDAPLPLIEWHEQLPAFNVVELQDYDEAVKKQFSKPFMVFLGAYTGCSCGFSYDSENCEDERDEIEDRDARESVGQMVTYLSDQAKKSSLELFACWNGDQGDPPATTKTVTPDYFLGPEFPIGDEPTFLSINRA